MTAMYTLRRGGAYDRFIMMLEAFLERDCEIHCLSLSPIQIKSALFNNHVIQLPFHLDHPTLTKISVLLLFPFYTLLVGWREKIDLFIAFGTLYAFIESIPKWILKKPMVTFLRGRLAFGMETQRRSRLLTGLSRWIEKIGIYSSDLVLSVNSTLQEEMRRLAGSRKGQRWEVLPNNIPPMSIPENLHISEMRQTYGIPEDAKLLVTAGVINRGKNIDLLIKCFSAICLKNIYLLIVGVGSTEADFQYQADLKELVKNLKLRNRVIFTGWVEKEELWRIFYGADLFILSSKSEGMPNVMLEALGCDLPCMGSNIAGIKDILNYDELLFDPFDKKMLAGKIEKVLSDPQDFNQVKQLCQERKMEFIFNWKERIYHFMEREPIS